jgi:hypothetical protein
VFKIGLLLLGLACAASAASISDPFSADYQIVDLGAAPAVAAPYGGITFEAGNNNILLLGGSANNGGGVIDALGILRGADGHITGFDGSDSLFSTAPQIDGGLAYAPNGDLLFTEYSNNQIGEIKPGSTSPDKTVDAPAASSVGTLGFIPLGYPGAGSFILGSYSGGGWCTSTLTPDGSGTYDITGCDGLEQTGGGPEGIIYVPAGSADFSQPSVLLSLYSIGAVDACTLDTNGLPLPASCQSFITDLSGVEGAVLDPVTGDFLFSTFGGGNHVFEIQGFAAPAVPEPGTLALLAGGILIVFMLRRRLLA